MYRTHWPQYPVPSSAAQPFEVNDLLCLISILSVEPAGGSMVPDFSLMHVLHFRGCDRVVER